jgi:hypothetical protein
MIMAHRERKQPAIRFPLTREQIQMIWTMLQTESDRGCVLTVGSVVDLFLEGMLRTEFKRRALADTGKQMDFLLTTGPIPPLRSTYLKATLAYCLGLLDSKTFNGIKTLNDIRNGVAHPRGPLSYADIGIHEILAIIGADNQRKKLITASATEVGQKTTRGRDRTIFEAVSHALIYRLAQLANHPEDAKKIQKNHMWDDLARAVLDEERQND